jgi:peptidoglycan/xylan/chitin deacetylase (PgdA/CDA1 family)
VTKGLTTVLALVLVGLAVVPVGASAARSPRASAGSKRRPPAPLSLAATSLTQSGQEVVWTLQTRQPFTPATFARGRRSLCLLLERPRSGTVAAQLCVTGTARAPRLDYMRVSARGPGPASPISAAVTLTGGRDLAATFSPDQAGLAYVPLRWQVITTLRSPRCVRTHHDRNGCVALLPRAPSLLALHVPRLVGCEAAGPRMVYSGPASQRAIALTFDDGPSPYTPELLTLLEQEHVPATFFEIGNQIALYGQQGAIERRMLADGDMIGDHTWDHHDVARMGPTEAAQELTRTAEAIRTATGGFTPCLFRPPYGDVSRPVEVLARLLGFTTIGWNVDPRDWARPGVPAIAGNVISHARPGAIVIQHDGGGDRSETVAAVRIEIDTLRHEGYTFETVTDLLGLRLIYK